MHSPTIHTDADLAIYTETLFQLTALDQPLPAQREAIELLTILVTSYEDIRYAVPPADPISILRFLMEHQNLTQRDLIPEFGSASAVSMCLSGQRKLTLEQIQKLSARFKLLTDLFMAKLSSS